MILIRAMCPQFDRLQVHHLLEQHCLFCCSCLMGPVGSRERVPGPYASLPSWGSLRPDKKKKAEWSECWTRALKVPCGRPANTTTWIWTPVIPSFKSSATPCKYRVKADLDGTTLTYDCRMQLAQVMTCVRLSQGFETCFKILQLFSSCMRQSWGSCEVDLHEAIRVVWMAWASCMRQS